MRHFIWIAIGIVMTMGCEKTIPTPINPSEYPITNFSDVFEAYWNGMNTRYVFWEWDTTNWDRVYYQYKPKFAALAGLSNNIAQDSAISYLKQMAGGLTDGHYNLEDIDSNGTMTHFEPSATRKATDTYFAGNERIPLTYFEQTLPHYWLDSPYVESSIDTIDNGSELVFALSGTIQHKILYLYFSTFNLDSFYVPRRAVLTKALNFFFDRFTADSTAYKGIIIDVRNNLGGSISDIDFMLGRIISQPVQYGWVRTKTGNGRLDYSPWFPATLEPIAGGQPLASSQKLVVLADNYSQSAAEQFTMAIKQLPNSTFIGDTTWGANGPFPASVQYPDYFSGAFYIGDTTKSANPNGAFAFVKTSSFAFKYINDTVYEGRGFPPDILVHASSIAALKSGTDSALHTAVNLILP